MTDHKISVLMGAYNCEETLPMAVKSIQKQTYENWELIICDDGSADNTYEVAKALAERDSRIVLLRNERNLGLNRTLNYCLAAATGDLIARMDGDDESVPDRFERQVSLLCCQDSYQITSSSMILFDESGEWGLKELSEFPTAKDIVEGTAVCHAPVMMRKECLDAVGGYSTDKRTYRVEDLDLWIRLYGAGYRFRNIKEPLYRMRNDSKALARRKYKYRLNATYVRLRGCRTFHLSLKSYLKAFTPLISGLVLGRIRQYIRKKQRSAE